MNRVKKIDEWLKENGVTLEEANRLGITDVILECKKREVELENIEKQNEIACSELDKTLVKIKKELQEMHDNAQRLKAMVEFQIKGRSFDA